MHILGLVFLSFSSQYYQIFLSESILSGIGASTLYYASLNAVSTYFWKRKAFAIGIVGTGASLGGILIPIIFDSLIARGVDFGWAVRILAFTFLILLVVGNLACTSRLVHHAQIPHILDFFRPFKEVEYVLLSMGGFCTFWALFVPNTYLPSYARSQGASNTIATSTLIVLNASR
ncbi:hypothetical protein JX265_010785 [Neoarthrinium moseri]|uniref:Major facilitator superfamily (MFS) profile domain-containing protein n=1 Tax=Neoarthrinium moseri TaxID=1658444 RepID=A0A9P9WDG2_9PEZI|nr:uncharacterized protein JN550_010649 [Neoarthrinium moseri]KAI1840219.1 hypothetical protein JX266_013586 [Neoarthrinium moseri]KAI1858117.1 hypothetical protein JX265_010785 [Neoarthrinium moseri]KAI1862018.1 hypothetical protein JN550_010649 [Neoarthrinium moseri]